MLITMLMDHEDSLNGGATRQMFRAGQSYDLPVKMAETFIAEGRAQAAGGASREARPSRASRGKE